MNAITDGLQRELKTMPVTLVVITLMIAATSYLWHDKASASDIEAVKQSVVSVNAQVVKLSQTIERRQIEARVAAIESELFVIEQKIKDAEARHAAVDDLYYARRNQLRTDHDQALRELQSLPAPPAKP